ncbi:MAG: hypothetical protein K6A37_06155 [Saccharofermentans sp.]|nr:hypothetical protein [Saccharofermentans sp.]
MKRNLICCLILCAAALCSCGSVQEPVESSINSSVVTSSETTPVESSLDSSVVTSSETTETPVEFQVDEEFDWQLQVIYENSDMWFLPDPDIFDEGFPSHFAVTDLDRDGYLEICKCRASNGNGGPVSSIWIYEVGEDATLIERISSLDDPQTEFRSSDYPDIWGTFYSDPMGMYQAEDGTYMYLVSNSGDTSISGGYSEYGVMYLRDDIYYFDVEFSRHVYLGETDYEYLYYDSEGNEISEEEYNEILAEYESRGESETYLGWFSELTEENITGSFLTCIS